MQEILKRGLSHFGAEATDIIIDRFVTYSQLLREWNEKINLTAITEPDEIAKKHFVDSVSCVSMLGESASLVDVGTGAGFPGIPLKIVRDDISVLLLDSLGKRVDFLNRVITELGLNNIEAVHSRAEDGGTNPLYRERFDVATARAVAGLNVLSEYCVPFVKVGGQFIALKGPDCDEEVATAKNAIKTLGCDNPILHNVHWEEHRHTLVVCKKIKSTDKKYPRKAGKPSKNPL